jgi:predicted transposase YbfD/YdcC
MADAFDKSQVVVGEVEVRLARPEERRRWDALMDRYHYLGFRQFAGRGLRHVALWCGWWVALLGWQAGAFKCAPRDRWVGWHRSVQFRRLHLIGNNTRFLILPEALGIRNLASRVLGRSVRRVSADWKSAYGHPLELAETFVDPNRFHGGAYDASNWARVGRTKGFARHNGAYTDPHGVAKEMFVRPLRADARERLADPSDRAEWTCRATPVTYTREELRSLRELFAEMPDCRRGQGMKHRLATVLSVCALARLAGVSGPAATERFAKHLSQEELRALGAWRDPVARRWVAPSDSTLCRVLADTDPDALADVLRRWAAPRAVPKGTPPALAADGKRIRGANRHTGESTYFETVTLVTHEGRPLASRCCRDEGGESAAAKALLEEVDVRGCVITLDALHTTYDTERAIVDIHGAEYLFTVKGNCPETFAALAALDWDAPGVRHHRAPPEKGHGRLEARRLDALTLPRRMLSFDKARQAMRVTRERTELSTGETTIETVYALTSVSSQRASPEQLLAWNRGHWAVENANHYRRDATLGEDASRIRARHAPANNATLNNIALAIVFHRGFHHLPEAHLHFMMQRHDALDAILSPT